MKLRIFLGAILSYCSISANATCFSRQTGSVPSICNGREIPASKARNFNRNSQTLLCSSASDHFVRAQQRYDFEKWNNFLLQSQPQSAQDLRKGQPDITWEGSIPYSTVEYWTWQSCDLVRDGSACGYETKTRLVTRYRENCSGSGKQRTCRSESYQVTETYQEPRTCWTDVTRTEHWPCSNETMTYSAKFDRPNYSEWKPGSTSYVDALPNKYDLLPGEVEDIQSFSNDSLRENLHPKVEVGDAWNVYSVRLNGSAIGAVCKQNDRLHFNALISTEKRNPNKKTPNAFKLPQNLNGESISSIIWESKMNTKNQIVADGIPLKLRLADSSSGVINTIAAQSKKTADREQKKQERGQGKSQDDMSPGEQIKAGFFKNTKVRVRLIKENQYLFDTTATKRMLLGQEDAIVPSTNLLSEDQDIAYSDLWEIPLRTKNSPGVYASKFMGRDRALSPGQKYYFEVSMYQRGAKGLYLQDCDELPSFWSCKFRWMGLGRTEANIYSEPLKIPFQVNAEVKDERGLFDKLIDWVK